MPALGRLGAAIHPYLWKQGRSIMGESRFEAMKRKAEMAADQEERKQRQKFLDLLHLHADWAKFAGGKPAAEIPFAVLSRRAEVMAGLAVQYETWDEMLDDLSGEVAVS